MHARTWNRRGMETLRHDLNEMRRRKMEQASEIPVDSGASKTKKDVGGRPPLEIDLNEVYDALREGLTVTEVAKKFGISRGSVYKFKEGM